MPDLAALQAQLGYSFRDESLLRLALTHPSVAHEQGTPVEHNQRLEFLGDAVLQLVLTRELYEKFPDFDEGPLTKARAKLVNRRTLAVHGRALGLGELKFSGQVLPNVKKVIYGIDIKRVMRGKLVLGIADGWLSADGEVIYRASNLKVGLFKQGEALAPSGA